ncbi:MAG TPA: TIGR03086 family metal-binding protein [Propionibacteriaceae bacterium]|nr:TIGR03086 family metal-binding protein [Propionibacteriaceae bacterium]
MTLDLDAPAADMARIAAGISDDQLDDPTPCPGIDVRGMLAHVLGLSVSFRDAAHKVEGPTTSTPPGPARLPQDWRDELPHRLIELVAAWRESSAWDGEATVGGVTSPAAQTAAFGNNELVVHGWDLAVSTGQPYSPAEPNLLAAYQLASSIPDDPQARRGLFGPRVAVPDDASLLERTLAAAGRDPRWRPA